MVLKKNQIDFSDYFPDIFKQKAHNKDIWKLS